MEYTLTPELSPNRTEVNPGYVDEYGLLEHRDPSVDTLFHENTKLDERRSARDLSSVETFVTEPEKTMVKALEPDIPHAPEVELPPVDSDAFDTPLGAALDARRSDLRNPTESLDLSVIAGLLGRSIGTTDEESLGGDRDDLRREVVHERRAYPSAGALYAVETYLVVRSVDGLDPGVYFYQPQRHLLRVVDRWPDEDEDRLADAFVEDPQIGLAGAAIVTTVVIPRIRAKYGPRGYRYALLEAGHLGQNVQLVGTALGVATLPYGGYLDGELNDILGVDGFNEAVVGVVLLGGDGARDAAGENDGDRP